MCTGEGTTDKIRRGKRLRKLHWLCWGLFSANATRRTEWIKWPLWWPQETRISASNNLSSGSILHVYIQAQQWSAFTIGCKCDKEKLDKCQSNHHFPLHLPQQTKHHTGETQYAALIWYSINFQWFFRIQIIRGRGRESTKLLGVLNLPWQGFGKNPSRKLKHMQAWKNG